jgi:transposase InsO family protein
VVAVCDTFLVSRAGYYAWQTEEQTAREQRDGELMPLVRDLFWKHKRRYGARRIAVELGAMGEPCGVDRVAKLLKMQGLKAIQPKSFKPKTTESRHTLGYSPNLLLSAPPPEAVNQVWIADITYIPLRNGSFVYLALLMDLFSRRVIGWRLAEHMTEELVLDPLHQAIRSRQPAPGLIHHSDRGGQYAGHAYRGVLRRAAMRQSMSRAANCYDNAFMESCFGTIKTELEMTEYEEIPSALREITSYLAYYNLERRHSSLDYLSPSAFERLNQALNHHPK